MVARVRSIIRSAGPAAPLGCEPNQRSGAGAGWAKRQCVTERPATRATTVGSKLYRSRSEKRLTGKRIQSRQIARILLRPASANTAMHSTQEYTSANCCAKRAWMNCLSIRLAYAFCVQFKGTHFKEKSTPTAPAAQHNTPTH